MRRVILIEDVLELEIRRPQAVAEVLGEDPAAVYISIHSQSPFLGVIQR